MAAKLPPYVVRVAANLEQETDGNLLRLTAVLLENDRELLISIGRGHAAEEIDAVYLPFVRELVRRADELDVPALARGHA